MGKVYTREELEGIRDRVLIQAKAFYESQGRMPSIRELLDITGVTQHAIYKVFGGKAGIEDALNEGSTREEELPKELKEKRAASSGNLRTGTESRNSCDGAGHRPVKICTLHKVRR